MDAKEVLFRSSLYEDCAVICERVKFTEKWIRPTEKYKELIRPYFYDNNCKHPVIVPIIGWAGFLGSEIDLFMNDLLKELENDEFKETKIVLNRIGHPKTICNYIISLGVLKHALEGIGPVISKKKLEFGLIVTGTN